VTGALDSGCPCGCGKTVPPHLFACRLGWFRLPSEIRDDITGAWRAHDWQAHAAAKQRAREFYAAERETR
jgi:hypothetical protein